MKNLLVVVLGFLVGCGTSGIKPGDTVGGVKFKVMTPVDLTIPPLWAFDCNSAPQITSDTATQSTPGAYNTTCTAPAAGTLLPIGQGWAASTTALRDSRWTNVSSWKAVFDGKEIDLEAFGHFDGDIPTGPTTTEPGRIWNVNLDNPPAGHHTLEWKFVLAADQPDGSFKNLKGTYDLNYAFDIVAPSAH